MSRNNNAWANPPGSDAAGMRFPANSKPVLSRQIGIRIDRSQPKPKRRACLAKYHFVDFSQLMKPCYQGESSC
ncbi:hypothetical protein K458DRAFT_413052 [Lentithecium fluviatile CBS 122367]|uniref:Uncharacterized protein n=1 Tax=Lentithecium fluviatile CBS 122367 TaxID=1168545 RepID=A0A6G1JJ30_9PLEO|nr:hypothetical protein K458DRAFT_413052 [Lentithecium fluviatile CBS 122367]